MPTWSTRSTRRWTTSGTWTHGRAWATDRKASEITWTRRRNSSSAGRRSRRDLRGLDARLPAFGQDEDDLSGLHEVQRFAGGLFDRLRVVLERRDLGLELPVVLVELRDLRLHLLELRTLPPHLKEAVLVDEEEPEDERREKERDRDVGRRPHVRHVRARAGCRRRRFGRELGQRARAVPPGRRGQPPHTHDPGRTFIADDSLEPHRTFSREKPARVSLSSRRDPDKSRSRRDLPRCGGAGCTSRSAPSATR